MNYFVEGLQGSGKSTLVEKLKEKNPGYTAIKEGDYSPIELAWCALMNESQYTQILSQWKDLEDQFLNNTRKEGDHFIVCYTKVKSEDRSFYQQLENNEIYNGRIGFEEYKDIVLSRYRNWKGNDNVFECSLLQNGVEDMILFRDMSDDEILDFYREVRKALEGKDYHIYYIETADIERNLNVIRKERIDKDGNEIWFEMLMGYFVDSPYAIKRNLKKYENLLKHLEHRQELELRICREIFSDKLTIVQSKAYDL